MGERTWVGATQKVPGKALLGTFTTQSDRVCRSCERAQDRGGPGVPGRGLRPHVETAAHTNTHTSSAADQGHLSHTHACSIYAHSSGREHRDPTHEPQTTPAPRMRTAPTSLGQHTRPLCSCSQKGTHSPRDGAHTQVQMHTQQPGGPDTHTYVPHARVYKLLPLSLSSTPPPATHTHTCTHVCTHMSAGSPVSGASSERLWSEPRIQRPPSGALLPR